MKKDTKQQTKKIKILEKENESLKTGVAFIETVNPEILEDLEAFKITARHSSAKEECTVITQLGDVHIDEIVNKNITNGLNMYNHEIGAIRIEKYFQRTIYMTRFFRKSGVKIDNMVLHLVGDFLSGWIHQELIETNSMSPISATLLIEELLIKGIKSLSESGDFKKIVIPCSIGNHSRTTQKNHFKNTAVTSYEWIIYHHLKNYFEQHGYDNVTFLISESPYLYYDIYGKINKFSHGNHFNYQGGIGGIEVPLKKWMHRENMVVQSDMSWIGHWHTYFVGARIRVNGSLIGFNEMGRSFGFTPEPPQMQFQLLDKKRGYTWNCPILLNDFK